MKYLLVITLFFLASCNNGKPPVTEAKMALVLTDLHLAEARATQLPPDSGGHSDLGRNLDSLAVFYKEVLHRYNLDTAQFRQALDWYMAHPKELDSVYKMGIAQLENLSPGA